jgi:tryptophan synthase alpha subunit
MTDKTMVEKAGEAVGFGIAMAEDVAGAVKTAVGVAVTTVTGVLKKAPPTNASVKQVAKKTPAKKPAKKTPATKAIKKT